MENNIDDDFYTIDFDDDDFATPQTGAYTDDYTDDYSSKFNTWFNNIISNTTGKLDPTGDGHLTPVEDVNPDNVLANLAFNSVVCVLLLGLYEILRRWIPSVYSQRLVHGGGVIGNDGQVVVGGVSRDGLGRDGVMKSGGSMSPRSSKLAMMSGLNASGTVGMNASIVTAMDGSDASAKNNGKRGDRDSDQHENSSSYRFSTPMTFLEWCYPILSTPWSTIRQLSGLDAYFFLRYIRMCLKITAVSSFWACAILCPVYATGGGNQKGFYHFSMANVLQNDKLRVWVPTIFCWAFTSYCWFCVRGEMIHYAELRMQFLGGEEDDRKKNADFLNENRETSLSNGSETINMGDQSTREEREHLQLGSNSDKSDVARSKEDSSDEISSAEDLGIEAKNTLLARDEAEINSGEQLAGDNASSSPLLPYNESSPTADSIHPSMSSNVVLLPHEKEGTTKVDQPALVVVESQNFVNNSGEGPDSCQSANSGISFQQINQHRYSLQVEKVPSDLRSDTALFQYFNDMFPNQVHSVSMAMNVPDLDALSLRRLRVTRRLEKSIAFWHATKKRPTHVTGRPRCQCLRIESTPIDLWCLLCCCCCFDSCKRDADADSTNQGGWKTHPAEIYEYLPEKGECVDSISYYTRDLAECNIKLSNLQQQKFQIAQTGSVIKRVDDRFNKREVIGTEEHHEWYARPLGWAKEGAALAAEGLRDEFEVLTEDNEWGVGSSVNLCGGEEDVLFCGSETAGEYNGSKKKAPGTSSIGAGYGSLERSYPSSLSSKRGYLSSEKDMPLVQEDHLVDSDHNRNSAHSTRAVDTSTSYDALKENGKSNAKEYVPVITSPNGDQVFGISREGHGSSSECEERNIVDASLEKKQMTNRSRPHRWLRAILWRMGVDFLAAGLDELKNSTDVVVDSVTRPSMSSTGFVTFKTLTPVTVCTSAPITYKSLPIEVFVAPEPRDIVWHNVPIDKDIGASREFVANILLTLGVLLWSVPLTLIQAWAKVEKVALIPGLDWISDIHGGAWKSLINGYLPVITLLGLIMLLPIIFQAVATSYEKRKTYSGVESSIVGRYFYYQLANIYITVTAGALWTSLAEILDHPQQLLVILGQTLPKVAGYFISLLITKILAGLPMVLLRTGALSRMIFLRTCFNRNKLTQRELDEVYRKQPIMYGWEYPTQFLVIIICFTYACITPFILPVGALYFFFALMVYKKQALYVYTPTYESGGVLFPQAIDKTLFALLLSQMTFIGYTMIRKGLYQLLFLIPLPFLTVFFNIHINSRYVKPSTKLSLERALKLDSSTGSQWKSHPEFREEAYRQPVLTEKASVPLSYRRGKEDEMLLEVLRNLRKLQNEAEPEAQYT